MADLDITIAGRAYRVACEDGQEDALAEAAGLIAREAEELRAQFGDRFAALSESRVLLMAGLMLADRHRVQSIELAAAAPAPESPAQPAFFEDPAQAARIAALETELEDALERAEAAERALAAAREAPPQEANAELAEAQARAAAAEARMAAFERDLAAAREAEAAARAAVDEATRRVRALVSEITEAA